MRVISTVMSVAAAALLISAVPSSSQAPVQAAAEPMAPSQAEGEYRGELHPNPETGCIEIPDEPGEQPRISPADETPDAAVDVSPPGAVADTADGGPDHDTEPWPGQEFDLYAQPWPLCDAPEVSVTITEDGHTVVEKPSQ